MEETIKALSPEKKFKTLFLASIYFFVLPVTGCFILYYGIDFLDNNGIKLPKSVVKNLWIPAIAIIGGFIWCLYTLIVIIGTIMIETPTENPVIKSEYNYQLVFFLWLFAIITFFIILVIMMN